MILYSVILLFVSHVLDIPQYSDQRAKSLNALFGEVNEFDEIFFTQSLQSPIASWRISAHLIRGIKVSCTMCSKRENFHYKLYSMISRFDCVTNTEIMSKLSHYKGHLLIIANGNEKKTPIGDASGMKSMIKSRTPCAILSIQLPRE